MSEPHYTSQVAAGGRVSGDKSNLELGRGLLHAIEDKLQNGGYGSVREMTTQAEVTSDATLVMAHALIDIAESLRNYLPGRVA